MIKVRRAVEEINEPEELCLNFVNCVKQLSHFEMFQMNNQASFTALFSSMINGETKHFNSKQKIIT